MFHPRRSRLRRSLVAALAAGSSVVVVAPAASADDVPAGSTVVGTVVRAYVEHKDEHDAGAAGDFGAPLTFVRSSSGAPVRVPTQALKDVPLGATVSVKVGGDVKDAPATADALDPAKQVLAASVVAPPSPAPAAGTAATGPTPTDTVSIAMVTPPGTAPDGTTLATLVNQVAGPVTQFWASQSNGAIQLAVADTHGWGTTTVTTDCSDPEALWAQVAQQVSFVPGPGKHLMLYLPNNAAGCAYGLAEVGYSLHAGGYLYVTDTPTSVIAHELGHNFGLLHSGRTECQGAVETGACTAVEYGDLYDVMASSWSQVGSLNAAQSARLGFLPSTQTQSLTASGVGGTFSLSPLSATSGTRAIRLTAASGSVYYLEYRSASGQDAYLGNASANWPGLPTGVLLHRAEATDPADSSMLLDGTPTASSSYAGDANDVLPIGTPVIVAGGAFALTLLSAPGATASVRVTTAADTSGSAALVMAYALHGGATGPLGMPLSGAACGLVNDGCFEVFQGGTLYSSPASGTHFVRGAIRTLWNVAGAENSWLGYPTTDELCGLKNGGCVSYFQNGSIFWSQATGPHLVNTALMGHWQELGWESGVLGYPISDVACGGTGAGYGCSAVFQGGSLYWSPATGGHFVRGAIRGLWSSIGSAGSWLGYPTTDELCGLKNGGCVSYFQNGSIFWSQATGPHLVNTALMGHWQQLGWESGVLGYPISDVACGGTGTGYGCSAVFQGGSLYWSPATGGHFVRGAIRGLWSSIGASTSWLGYPITDETCGLRDSGCFAHFQNGSIYWSPTTGADLVYGAIRDAWAAAGWENGGWGYPTANPTSTLTGVAQRFQGGTATYDSTTAQVTFR